MPRRHKPKWGWDGTGCSWEGAGYSSGYDFPVLCEESAKAVVDAIGPGATEGAEIVAYVQRLIQDLASDEHFQKNRPSSSEVKSALTALLHTIKAKPGEVADLLERLDGETVIYLENTDLVGREWDQFKREADPSALSEAIRQAILLIPPIKKRRPPKNAPQREFIKELAALYEAHTGAKPGITYNNHAPGAEYSGRFFDFVSTCLRVAGDSCVFGKRVHSNVALGKDIQRALQARP